MYKIFEDIQVQLLYYKYHYYEKSESVVTDHQYDVLEKISKDLAKALNIKDTCYSCIHNMVGFSKNSPYWDKVKERLI